jgi:hypothetical protein
VTIVVRAAQTEPVAADPTPSEGAATQPAEEPAGAAAPATEKKKRQRKAATATEGGTHKKLSAIDAAAQVLAQASAPLNLLAPRPWRGRSLPPPVRAWVPQIAEAPHQQGINASQDAQGPVRRQHRPQRGQGAGGILSFGRANRVWTVSPPAAVSRAALRRVMAARNPCQGWPKVRSSRHREAVGLPRPAAWAAASTVALQG